MNNLKRSILLAGNPNVGKSTLFNQLTGLNQHTGNWAGKTVDLAVGTYTKNGILYEIADLPGTYSLIGHSAEEDIASDYICYNKGVVVVICDATVLQRNLNLVLQILEITSNVVVCVNLMDEAKRKNIRVDGAKLEKVLNVPVVTISARNKKAIDTVIAAVERVYNECPLSYKPSYIKPIEEALESVISEMPPMIPETVRRFVGLKLLQNDRRALCLIEETYKVNFGCYDVLSDVVAEAIATLCEKGINEQNLGDKLSACTVLMAEDLALQAVDTVGCKRTYDRKLDRVLTSKVTGIPIMIMFLLSILWITIAGANYPSALLSEGFNFLEGHFMQFGVYINAPPWLTSMLVEGVFRVLAWVVAVMLPPMAIFFPLFTLLEDLGYLPRIAFNLDNFFRKAGTCGKQALTMCQGFGCNACGIIGARIIDSPRERLIAILTNNFVPCNGRFPTLITVASIFFIGTVGGILGGALSAVFLTAVIVFGIFMTFVVSKFLSKTLLKGIPSSFTLELPPYRKPQIGKVLVRSLLDRTLFVLGRAVVVAAPAGLLIWVLSNTFIDGQSVLFICSSFLEPLGQFMGLDGVILLAFILGFPANEIVFPIIIMCYMETSALTDFESLQSLGLLLTENGWTVVTAVCMVLFTLLHFPCSTSCITVYKETKSIKWTALAFLIPTVIGVILCILVSHLLGIFC